MNPTHRRPRDPRAGASAVTAAAAVAAWWLAHPARLRVEGESMLPTLRPGDRVLVTRGLRALRPGDLVALRDPRCPSRILVKRVAAVASGRVSVAGDNVEASTDSRTFGAVDAGRLLGRVRYRYAPPERAGRIGR